MCALTSPAQVTLPWTEKAPSMARDFVTGTACRPHARTVVQDAVLLVSELVTNAVQHGTPPVTLRVDCDGHDGGLCITVSDEHPDDPVERPLNLDSEGGRGVRLVDVLSDRWGVVHHDRDGKAVWFQLQP